MASDAADSIGEDVCPG